MMTFNKNLNDLNQLPPLGKLSDFGLSRQVERYMTSNVGNCYYSSPEIFEGEKYTEKADMFSFSILFNEMMARAPPLGHLQPQRAAFLSAMKGVRPDLASSLPSHIQPAFEQIVQRGWVHEPNQRPSAEQVSSLLSTLMESMLYSTPVTSDLLLFDEQNEQNERKEREFVFPNPQFTVGISLPSRERISMILARHLQQRPPIIDLVSRGVLSSEEAAWVSSPSDSSLFTPPPLLPYTSSSSTSSYSSLSDQDPELTTRNRSNRSSGGEERTYDDFLYNFDSDNQTQKAALLPGSEEPVFTKSRQQTAPTNRRKKKGKTISIRPSNY